MRLIRYAIFGLAFLASYIGWQPSMQGANAVPGAAWADDDDGPGGGDDDGDDDGGDDGDDGGGNRGSSAGDRSSGGSQDRGGSSFGGNRDGRDRERASDGSRPRNPVGEPRRQTRAAPVVPAPPPPVSAPDEIVALALDPTDLAALEAQGFSLIEEIEVVALATISRRLRIPPDTSLAEARDIVRALPTGQDADFNHYYRAEQGFTEDCSGLDCPAREAIGWPKLPMRETACARSVSVGMIDTGINADHPTFTGARLEVHRLGPAELDPSKAVHGTAVAALLVGDPTSRSPGLIPGSRLVAVDAFHRSRGDERADVFTLIDALSFLASRGVGVINLSLAGPDNTVLSAAIDRLVTDGQIVVVSAVGNAGPNAEPAFPAAYDAVIAVTAVDRSGQVYRRAIRGPHVDIAAPGVNVWTAASISGARHKTGTSFAVPFVTAAAAMLREARPDLPASEVAAELQRLAVDIGEAGPDVIYGAGLLNIGTLCSGNP